MSEEKNIKDHNGETGRGRKIIELDGILGHRPASAPTALLDTGTSSATALDSQDTTKETETNGNLVIY